MLEFLASAPLNQYEICGVSNDWFKSYLSNHGQYASINGYEFGLATINVMFLKDLF